MSRLLPDLLRRHASERQDVLALATADGPGLTYGDWWARSSAGAVALAEAGVEPGDRIALIGSNAPYTDVGVAYIAILLAGATVLPLSSSQARPELLRAVMLAAPRLVITCDPALEPVPSFHTIPIEALHSHRTDAPDLPTVKPGMPAEVLSTSGTTGMARLVEATHANLSLDYEAEPRREQEPYHFVHALTLGTNIGQVALRSSLTLGYSVVALELFELDAYRRAAETLPMRETLLVPAMAAAVAADGHRRGYDLPDVDLVAVSGASTPPSTWQRLAVVFPNAQLINAYSTAEAWPARAVALVDPDRPHSVGRPLDDQAVEVRDERGCRVPALERGTIYLAHHTAPARRYLDGSRVSTHDGWVETDDLGYLDDDGFLYIDDRKSDVIDTGGHTVSTVEVEGVLTQHPQVVEAAVFGLPHPTLGSYVAACVTGPETLHTEEVVQLARGRLAPHKLPRVLERRDALPRTSSGKVDKRRLRDELASQGSLDLGSADGGDVELIRDIWEQVLGQPVLGIDQPFFALGGDSLSASRVAVRIRAELLESAPTAALLTASTIADQVRVVAAARAEL